MAGSRANDQKRLSLIRDLAYWVIALQVVDGVLTYVLASEGYAVEANPILRGIADGPWLLVVKALSAVMVVVLVRRLSHWPKYWPVAVKCFWGLLIFYSGVVLWNGIGIALWL